MLRKVGDFLFGSFCVSFFFFFFFGRVSSWNLRPSILCLRCSVISNLNQPKFEIHNKHTTCQTVYMCRPSPMNLTQRSSELGNALAHGCGYGKWNDLRWQKKRKYVEGGSDRRTREGLNPNASKNQKKAKGTTNDRWQSATSKKRYMHHLQQRATESQILIQPRFHLAIMNLYRLSIYPVAYGLPF